MKDEIYSSKALKEEAEKETGKTIIESNGGATRYSSRDKSYSNLFDFFMKVSSMDSKDGETLWKRKTSGEKIVTSAKAILALLVLIAFIILMQIWLGTIGVISSIFILFIGWSIIYQKTHKRK